MNKEDLLEPFERRQIRILQYLYRNNGEAKISEIASALPFSSRNLLMDDLQAIQMVLRPSLTQYDISFKWNDEKVHLHINGQMSLKTLIFSYYRQTPKISIIENIVLNPNLTSIQLATKLNFSVATLYRKIAELNDLLAPFHVKINQLQLTGPDLAIQHLMYELLWNVCPKDQYVYRRYLQRNSPLAETMHRLLIDGSNKYLAADGPRKLYTWLLIIRLRNRHANTTMTLSPLARQVYQTMVGAPHFQQLWRQLQDSMPTFMQRIEKTELEQSLLIFCVAHEVFPIDDAFWQPAVDMVNPTDSLASTAQTIHQEHVQPMLNLDTPTITRYSVATLYRTLVNLTVCAGHINVMRPDTTTRYYKRLHNELIIRQAHELTRVIVSSMADKFQLSVDPGYVQQLMVLLRLTLRQRFAPTYRIGVDPEIGEMWLEPFIQICQNYFNQTLRTTVEVFDPNKQYDLYLSDHCPDQPVIQATQTYILTDLGSEDDLNKITELLQTTPNNRGLTGHPRELSATTPPCHRTPKNVL